MFFFAPLFFRIRTTYLDVLDTRLKFLDNQIFFTLAAGGASGSQTKL